MIRDFFTIIALLVIFIGGLPLLLLCLLIGLFSKKAQRTVTMHIIRVAAKIVMFTAGEKVEVIGVEKVPTDRAVVFVGNHNSIFDVPTFYGHMPVPTAFIAKKEVRKIPLLNLWMYCMGCIYIDRSSPRKGLKAIEKGVERIKGGESVFVFPEGTRSKNGEMRPFKPGCLRLAEKTGCPIIPVAMTNTGKLFEGNHYKLHNVHCKLIFGDPILPEEVPTENKREYAEYVRSKVQALLEAHS